MNTKLLALATGLACAIVLALLLRWSGRATPGGDGPAAVLPEAGASDGVGLAGPAAVGEGRSAPRAAVQHGPAADAPVPAPRADAEVHIVEERYPSGELRARVPYVDDRKHGVATYFFRSGEVEHVMGFREGVPHGEMTGFYLTGAVRTDQLFEDGERVRARWLREDGSLEAEERHEEGRLVAHLRYDESGALAMVTPYDDPQSRKPNGARQWLSSDGRVEREESLVEGVRHGPARAYHPSGELQAERHYQDGVLAGPARTFHPSGRVASEVVWEPTPWGGRKLGLESHYDADGRLVLQVEWREDGTSRVLLDRRG